MSTELPFASCLCPSYRRPQMMGTTTLSFHSQDYHLADWDTTGVFLTRMAPECFACGSIAVTRVDRCILTTNRPAIQPEGLSKNSRW